MERGGAAEEAGMAQQQQQQQLRVTEFFSRRKRGLLPRRDGAKDGPGPGAAAAAKAGREKELLAALLASPPRPDPRPPAALPSSSSSSGRKRRRPEAPAAPRSGSARKKLLLPAAEGGPREAVPAGLLPASPPPLGPCSTPAGKEEEEEKEKDLLDGTLSPGPREEDGEEQMPPNCLTEQKGFREKLQAMNQKAKVPGDASEASSDLKSRLQRVRLLESKIRERRAAKTEGKTQSVPQLDEVPKLAAEASKKTPAFQRYHTLAQDLPPSLALPCKYKLLAEMFRSMDTIVAMLFNRSEVVTFGKVKQGVQDLMRRQFEERNVGQIQTVYPAAYSLRQEKNIPTFGSGSQKRSDYQLTIEPVLREGGKLSASCLLDRRKVFGKNLLNIVKTYHKAFLASLDPPMAVPDHLLTRWHPRFSVDEVPDVVPAELPQPPHVDKLTTAQEVLAKARSMLTPKMEKALANLALQRAESSPSEQGSSPRSAPSAPASAPSSLKGISQPLLERIRAKEAQKLQAAMIRNPQQEERLNMLARLPEMARVLRNVFVAEKKQALPLEVACSRMTASVRALMPPGEMEKHLRLFSELLPDWVSILTIRKDIYIKLDKSLDLNVITERLAARSKAEETL